MRTGGDKAAVWFGRGEKELQFYPFGIGGRGYLVPESRFKEIAQWTFWRAQLPVVLWILGFVPLVDLWAPSLSDTKQLDAPSFAAAILLLTATAAALASAVNRAAYSWLLKGCRLVERFPSRSEKKECSRQFGASSQNILFLPFPVAALGASACALTMFIGAVREDIPMWLLGALASPVFWYAFVKESVDGAINFIRARH